MKFEFTVAVMEAVGLKEVPFFQPVNIFFLSHTMQDVCGLCEQLIGNVVLAGEWLWYLRERFPTSSSLRGEELPHRHIRENSLNLG